jgi:hypothetical protein
VANEASESKMSQRGSSAVQAMDFGRAGRFSAVVQPATSLPARQQIA